MSEPDALDQLIGKVGDLLGLGVTLTQQQQDALTRYGGYQLQWGDDDTKNPPIYEGIGRVAPAVLPDTRADGFVTVLQKALQAIGIMPALPVTGVFDVYTSWQLREFQIYASMDTVATEDPNLAGSYADHLAPTPNAQKYQGDITGRLDGPTAVALQAWITNSYRCPVVAESRDQNFNLVVDNIWFPSEDAQAGHLCWVTDLTGTYTIDPLRFSSQGGLGDPHNRRILAGSYITAGATGGPVCQAANRGVISTVWFDRDPSAIDAIPQWTNITVKTLTGDDPALKQASAETISTYKVIRAVAQAETGATFDGVNGWDVAKISLGPYNFALFIEIKKKNPQTGKLESTGKTGPTELPAFLSFLASATPEDFNTAFGRYGIDVGRAWPTDATPPTANNLYDRTARKWVTFLQLRGLQPAPPVTSMAKNNVVNAVDADYFKSWHWFYRWVMACRLFPNFWLKSWDFCRYRLQILLSAPFPNQVGSVGPSVGLPAGTTLGQGPHAVYTSELAVTALLRAHVNLPGSIIGSEQASLTVVTSFINALMNDQSLASDPATWTAAQHQSVDQSLIDLLKANYPTMANSLQDALDYVSDAGPSVDPTPGSFLFDPP